MTWREKTLTRVLLLVARLLADDPALAAEVKALDIHIRVHTPEPVADPEGGETK